MTVLAMPLAILAGYAFFTAPFERGKITPEREIGLLTSKAARGHLSQPVTPEFLEKNPEAARDLVALLNKASNEQMAQEFEALKARVERTGYMGTGVESGIPAPSGLGVFYYYDQKTKSVRQAKLDINSNTAGNIFKTVFTPKQVSELMDVQASFHKRIGYNFAPSVHWYDTEQANFIADREGYPSARAFFVGKLFGGQILKELTSDELERINSIVQETSPEKLDLLVKEYADITKKYRAAHKPAATIALLLLLGGNVVWAARSALRQAREKHGLKAVKESVEGGDIASLKGAIHEDLSRELGRGPFARLYAAVNAATPAAALDNAGFRQMLFTMSTSAPRHTVPYALSTLNWNPEAPAEPAKPGSRASKDFTHYLVSPFAKPFPISFKGTAWTGVGMSPSRNPSSKPTADLVLHTLFLAENFPHSTMVIADNIAVRNRMALYGEDFSEAYGKVSKEAADKKAAIEGVKSAFGIPDDRLEVRTWSDVEGDPAYQQNLARLERLRKRNPFFRRDLTKLVPASLKEVARKRLDDELPKRRGIAKLARGLEARRQNRIAVAQLSDYALAELALILSMPGLKVGHSQERGYDELAHKIALKYGLKVSNPSSLNIAAASFDPYDSRHVRAEDAERMYLTGSSKGLEGYDWHAPNEVVRSGRTGLNFAYVPAHLKLSPDEPDAPYLYRKARNAVLLSDSEGEVREKTGDGGKLPRLLQPFVARIPSLRLLYSYSTRDLTPQPKPLGVLAELLSPVRRDFQRNRAAALQEYKDRAPAVQEDFQRKEQEQAAALERQGRWRALRAFQRA